MKKPTKKSVEIAYKQMDVVKKLRKSSSYCVNCLREWEDCYCSIFGNTRMADIIIS